MLFYACIKQFIWHITKLFTLFSYWDLTHFMWPKTLCIDIIFAPKFKIVWKNIYRNVESLKIVIQTFKWHKLPEAFLPRHGNFLWAMPITMAWKILRTSVLTLYSFFSTCYVKIIITNSIKIYKRFFDWIFHLPFRIKDVHQTC